MAHTGRMIGADFILTEVKVVPTLCQVVKSRRLLDLDDANGIKLAELALATAERFMWGPKPTHRQFSEMMALSEQLKFEIASLKSL